MKKPLIGITCSLKEAESRQRWEHRLYDRYVLAVLEAGGAPVLLPAVEDEGAVDAYTASLDGIIISGGADIPPDLYGEEPLPEVETSEAMRRRALFEQALVHRVLERDQPFLGICHGCQLLNVALGGSLYQHIPTQIQNALAHRQEKSPHTAKHPVTLDSSSKLASLLQVKHLKSVVSSHHQAVKKLGKGLRIAATAPDGVIEAIELPSKPFVIGVQWHPEMSPDAEHAMRLLRAFVEACQKRCLNSV